MPEDFYSYTADAGQLAGKNDKAFLDSLAIKPADAWTPRETQRLFWMAMAMQERLLHGPWVPCSERMPPHDRIVIIEGGIGYWDGLKKGWFTLTGETWPGREIAWKVTHWMPLPELQPHATGGR